MPNIRIKNIFNTQDNKSIKSGILNSSVKKMQDSFDFLNGKYFSKQEITGKQLDISDDYFDDSETLEFKNINSNVQINIPYIDVKYNNETIDYYITTNQDLLSQNQINISNVKHENRLFSKANIINTPNNLDLQNYKKTLSTKDINLKQNLKNKQFEPFFENTEILDIIENLNDTNFISSIDNEIKQNYNIKDQKIIELNLDFSESNDLHLTNSQLFFNSENPDEDENTFNDNINITEKVNFANKLFNLNNNNLTTLSSHLLTSSFYNFNDNSWEYNTISKKINDVYYNFNLSSKDFISSSLQFPKLIKDKTLNTFTNLYNFTHKYILNNPINTTQSFNKDDQRYIQNQQTYNIITNTFGFPNSQVWKTTKNHIKNLKNFINSDFLIEKIIIKGNYSALLENPNKKYNFYNSENNLIDNTNQIYETYIHKDSNQRFASNITFSLLKEKNKKNKINNKNISGYAYTESSLDVITNQNFNGFYLNKDLNNYLNFNSIPLDIFSFNDINTLEYNENNKIEYFKLNNIDSQHLIDENSNKYFYLLNNDSQQNNFDKFNTNLNDYKNNYFNENKDIINKFENKNYSNNEFSENEKELISYCTLNIENNNQENYKVIDKQDFIITKNINNNISNENFDENSFNIRSNFYNENVNTLNNSQNIIKYNIENLILYFENEVEEGENFIYKNENGIETIFGINKNTYAYYTNPQNKFDIQITKNYLLNLLGFPIRIRFFYEIIDTSNKTINDFFTYNLYDNFYTINLNLFLLEFFISTDYTILKFLNSSEFYSNLKNQNILNILNTNLFYSNNKNRIFDETNINKSIAIIRLLELTILNCIKYNIDQNIIESNDSNLCISNILFSYNNNENNVDLFNKYKDQYNLNLYGNNFSLFDSNTVNNIRFDKLNNNFLTNIFENDYNFKISASTTSTKYYYNKINISTGEFKENDQTFLNKKIESNLKINQITKNNILQKEDNILLNASSFSGFNNLISNVTLHDKLKIYLIGRDISKKTKNDSIFSSAIKKVFENDYFENKNKITKINVKTLINEENDKIFINDTISPKLNDVFNVYNKNFNSIKHTIDINNNKSAIKYILSDIASDDDVFKNFANDFIFKKFNKLNDKKFITNYNTISSENQGKDIYLNYDINSINFGNDKYFDSWFKNKNINNSLYISLKQQFINNIFETEDGFFENKFINLSETEETENKFINNLNQFELSYIDFTINLINNRFTSLQFMKIPKFLYNCVFDSNKVENYFDIFQNNENNEKINFNESIKNWCYIFDLNEEMLEKSSYFDSLITLIKNKNNNIKVFKFKNNNIENEELYFSDLFIFKINNKFKNFYVSKDYDDINNKYAYHIIIPLMNNEIIYLNENNQLQINNLLTNNDYNFDIQIKDNFIDDIMFYGISQDLNINYSDFDDIIDQKKYFPLCRSFDQQVATQHIKYINSNNYFNAFFKEFDLNLLNFVSLKNKLENNSFIFNKNKNTNMLKNNIFLNQNTKYLINNMLFSDLKNIDLYTQLINKKFINQFNINRKIYISNIYYKKNNKYIKTKNQLIYEIKENININLNNKIVNILGFKNSNRIIDFSNYFDDSLMFEYEYDLFDTDFFVFENDDLKLNDFKVKKQNPLFMFNFKSQVNNIKNTKILYSANINKSENEIGTPLIKITNENENKLNEFLYSYRKNKKYKKSIDKKDGIIYCLKSTNIKKKDIKTISNSFGMIADNINFSENEVLIDINNEIKNITVEKKFVNEYFMYIETANNTGIHLGSNIDQYARSYYPFIENLGNSSNLQSLIQIQQ